MLAEGSLVENFQLQDASGELVSLESFRGKKLVVYFYPRDNTPGCTTEACNFRDEYSAIRAKGAEVIGISGDSVQSHEKFAGKYELPFILLSDPERKIIDYFGALQEKNMYGKTFLGIVRSTFILDKNGVVLKVFPKVKVKDHVNEVLEYL